MKYLIALLIGAGVLGAGIWKYDSMKEDVAKAKAEVTRLNAVVAEKDLNIEAYQKANQTLAAQIEGKDNAQKLNAVLTSRVNSLRKSVDELTAKSSNSLEACNRSFAVTGELLGECGERYQGVARKAELLRQDAIALDNHADLLQGLVSNLEPLNGYK